MTPFGEQVDLAEVRAWRLSAVTVLRAIDHDGHHHKEFQGITEENGRNFMDAPYKVQQQVAVLKSLRDDFDGGFLSDVRGLIRAEVFTDFIDQAQHLLDEGYWQPAIVIVGAILEDHLRKLCAKHPTVKLTAKPKLDTMNADLVKIGEYNVLTQKRVTWLADIRNKAAHGKWSDLKHSDAEEMVLGVQGFLTAHP